jgi:hypothetical protein
MKLTREQWHRVKWANVVMVPEGLHEFWNDDKWTVIVEGPIIYFKHPQLGCLALSNYS